MPRGQPDRSGLQGAGFRYSLGGELIIHCVLLRYLSAHQYGPTSKNPRGLLRLWRWLLQPGHEDNQGLQESLSEKCRYVHSDMPGCPLSPLSPTRICVHLCAHMGMHLMRKKLLTKDKNYDLDGSPWGVLMADESLRDHRVKPRTVVVSCDSKG